jgi:nitroreductase
VELHEAIRRRSMVRSFSTHSLDRTVLGRILEAGLHAPTAGNTGGTAFVVLSTPAETAAYWSSATDEAWRASSARFPGLARAPVILLAYASPDAYVARYAEPDKADSLLGTDPDHWPVPYWTGDAAFAVMSVLLAAVDAGLGACLLGNFRGEDELATALGVPDDWRLFAGVALGHPDGQDHRSVSLDRPLPSRSERLHWGRW